MRIKISEIKMLIGLFILLFLTVPFFEVFVFHNFSKQLIGIFKIKAIPAPNKKGDKILNILTTAFFTISMLRSKKASTKVNVINFINFFTFSLFNSINNPFSLSLCLNGSNQNRANNSFHRATS